MKNYIEYVVVTFAVIVFTITACTRVSSLDENSFRSRISIKVTEVNSINENILRNALCISEIKPVAPNQEALDHDKEINNYYFSLYTSQLLKSKK